MRISRRQKRFFSSLALTAVAAGAVLPNAVAYCTTCYLGATGAGDKGIRALQMGIIVLIIPTAIILGGILWYAFRYQDPATVEQRQEIQGNYQEKWLGKAVRFATAMVSLSAIKPH
ncbi:MAG: hypothetical protein HY313_07650 [Acidobacteria bacterium]|nr:hypothetical protein [Acidobacteriota bacterium]